MNRKHPALKNLFPAFFFTGEFFFVHISLFGSGGLYRRDAFLPVLNGRFTELAYLYFLIAGVLFVQELYAGCAANRANAPATGEQFPNTFTSMRF
jgi:hypothetical protein